MAKVDKYKELTYKEYLTTFNKSEVVKILDLFRIEYKKNQKKKTYIDLVLNNTDKIVNDTLNIFQRDEFHNIKLLVKKKGRITIRINHLLLSFLENLKKNNLIREETPKSYVMPKELLEIYKKKLKNKGPVEKCKNNTEEYALIMGFIDAYGAIEFNKFYDSYSKKYKLAKDKTLERIKFIADFYNEFRLYESKDKIYLASTVIKNLKTCNTLVKKKGEYAVYTNEELISIYNFSYMNKYKSYKKLLKFIKRNYYVEKSNFKVINNYILIPFLTNYQEEKENALKLLSILIDKHFEFNNQKHKNRFTGLIEKVALDYPSWELKGYSQRGKLC